MDPSLSAVVAVELDLMHTSPITGADGVTAVIELLGRSDYLWTSSILAK
jgi:hypothetical protein